MKPSELRIGNIVGIKSTAVHAKGCNHLEEVFEIEEIRQESVHFVGFAFAEFYKDLNPIPLTEEWVVRFGFEKYTWMNGYFKKTKFGHLMIQFYKEEIHLYVHQLQNLYFALTGQELQFAQSKEEIDKPIEKPEGNI